MLVLVYLVSENVYCGAMYNMLRERERERERERSCFCLVTVLAHNILTCNLLVYSLRRSLWKGSTGCNNGCTTA